MTAFRLVNAESDGVPGLIVDRYDDFLVIQVLTLGIERWKDVIVDLLAQLVEPSGIVERTNGNASPATGGSTGT